MVESPSRVAPEQHAGLSAAYAPTARAAGVVLAAGAGERMGSPKALLATSGTPWVVRAVDSLLAAGLDEVVVVLGAAAEAAALLPQDAHDSHGQRVRSVVAADWAAGPGASLRAGLAALDEPGADGATSAVITLVDLPDVGEAVVRRVLDATGTGPAALGRAMFAGRPGHPVVLGRDHWDVAPERRRSLLAGPRARQIECGDLATGEDLDHPDQLPPGTTRLEVRPDLPPTNRA